MEEDLLTPTRKRNRAAILRAFVSLLSERDFDEIRNQDIIERAEIAKSTFYQYFHHKDELRKALAHDYAASGEDLFRSIKANPKKREREEKMLLFLSRSRHDFRILLSLKDENYSFWFDFCGEFLKIHCRQRAFQEEVEASVFLLYLKRLLLEDDPCSPETLEKYHLPDQERQNIFDVLL